MPVILAVLALLIPAAVHAAPTTPRNLVTERPVPVMRHGIRAPLNGEVPEGTRTDQPWPAWPVAQSVVTPHGERALEIRSQRIGRNLRRCHQRRHSGADLHLDTASRTILRFSIRSHQIPGHGIIDICCYHR
ncbi:hypothetical protein [Novosphingobium sp.]|uniref:hypothetical protein n=1 Tax=Novosphingobium sp. TaxID=1874826 RepID=UPI002FE03518